VPIFSRLVLVIIVVFAVCWAPIQVKQRPGADFSYIFSAENRFPRKIPRNFLEERFFKTFSAENSIFSQHFWGKIFRGIFPEIFPRKKCTKNRPQKEKVLLKFQIESSFKKSCSGAHFPQRQFEEVILVFSKILPTAFFLII
jgi:hypothetical protein